MGCMVTQSSLWKDLAQCGKQTARGVTVGQEARCALECDDPLTRFGTDNPIGCADIVSPPIEEALQLLTL